METSSKRIALITNVLFIAAIGNLPQYLKFLPHKIRNASRSIWVLPLKYD